MTFVKVDYPIAKEKKKQAVQKDVDAILRAFLAMQTKAVRVDFGSDEYKSVKSARQALSTFMRNHPGAYPIKLVQRKYNGIDNLYMVRTDM